MQFKVSANVRTACALVLVAGFVAPTLSLSTGVASASVTASSPRSGALHVTKDCSKATGLAGGFCTITSSNLKAITVGSKVYYAQAAGAIELDSDVVLDIVGPGNNTAFGHCTVNNKTNLGLCTFWGGTGQFTWFHARVHVSAVAGSSVLYHWDGTYSLSRPY